MPNFNLLKPGALTEASQNFIGMAERSKALSQRDRQLDINQQQVNQQGAVQAQATQAKQKEAQKQEMRQQILSKAYQEGGLDGAISAIGQFDPEKAVDLKSKSVDLRAKLYETENTALSQAASKFAHTLVAADPESRKFLYKNGAKYLRENHGIELGEEMNSDDFLVLTSLGQEYAKGLSTIINDKDALRTAGPGILKSFTPENQAASDSILGSMISGTISEYQREQSRKDRDEQRKDISLGLDVAKAGEDKASSNIGKLQEDRARALATGDVTAVAQIDAAIEKANTPTEGIGAQIGAAQNAQLDKTELRKLKDKLLSKQQNIKQLESISKKLNDNPEIFTAKGRVDVLLANAKDYFNSASKSEKGLLAEATAVKGEIGRFLSAYAKNISGSAVAEQEFRRLGQQLINGKMSPTELKAGLENILGIIKDETSLLNDQIGSRSIGLNQTGAPDRFAIQRDRVKNFYMD